MLVLKGSDGSVWQLELLGSWTLSIVWYSKKLENTTFRKLYVFCPWVEGGVPTLLGPLERANL
jgi:hypothetical protein